MSPIHRLCPKCGALNGRDNLAGLCADCERADDRRPNQKRKDSGRTTVAWQRMRLAAFHRDGYACQRCGNTGDRKTLTVHLNPALDGDHLAASRDDLTTLCRSCHGSVDAPRSKQGTRTSRARSEGLSIG
jgi:5-methylcytosine-specific restriction endonuclease McrA